MCVDSVKSAVLRTVLVAFALVVGCEVAAVETASDVAVVQAAIVQDALVTATRDTHVRELAFATPAGSEAALRVQGVDRQRTLVQFDHAALLAAAAGRPVTEASLELTIQDTPLFFGQIAAHRMKNSWTEAGATWVCSNDTTPTNSTNNCTSANA